MAQITYIARIVKSPISHTWNRNNYTVDEKKDKQITYMDGYLRDPYSLLLLIFCLLSIC